MDAHRTDEVKPPYLQLAHDLRRKIRSGELPAGAKVPSIRTLAAEYGVAQMTATSALRALQAEGLIVTVTGRGTFVRSELPPMAEEPADTIAALVERVTDLEARVKVIETDRNDRG